MAKFYRKLQSSIAFRRRQRQRNQQQQKAKKSFGGNMGEKYRDLLAFF
jgi:hypothetical protein